MTGLQPPRRCGRGSGWLTDPDADRPVPCLRCRPWLGRRRPPTPSELADARRTALGAPHPRCLRTEESS